MEKKRQFVRDDRSMNIAGNKRLWFGEVSREPAKRVRTNPEGTVGQRLPVQFSMSVDNADNEHKGNVNAIQKKATGAFFSPVMLP